MRWGIFLFIFFFVFSSCNHLSSDQNQSDISLVNDSIQYWANTAKDADKLNLEDRKSLVKRAYTANSKVKDKTIQVKNLSRISLAYSRLDDSMNFRRTNNELMELAKKIGDNVAHGEAHWDLGDYFDGVQSDSSYYHYKEAYNLFSNTDLGKNKDYPARMLQAMASLRENYKDYAGAEKDIIAAIENYKQIGALDRMFSGYTTLGDIQIGLNKFDKALEYNLKAKEFIQYTPTRRHNSYNFQNQNNTAAVYLRKGDFDSAFQLFDKLEKKCRETGEIGLLMRKVYTSKALSGFKSGNLNAQQATLLIEMSNRGLDSLGNTYDMARNKHSLAEILLVDKRVDEAIAAGLEAKTIAENTGNNDRLLNVLEFLTQTDKVNSDVHAKAYFNLNEQLQLQERSMQDKFARIQMETDEVIEQNESLAKRTELLAGVAIGLLVLGIGIFTIISQRVSNQRLKFRQKQQESNQEIYKLMLAQHGKVEEGKKSEQKRVSEELHDGILGQMLGIRLVLSGLNERNDPSAIEQRAELIVKLQELEEEIRTISHELNASAYEKVHNFIISLSDLMETVEKSSRIEIHFDYDEQFDWDNLNGDTKIHSYRIIQELLQNCVKHADCQNIYVSFQKGKNLLNLTVRDDGKGFDDTKSKRGIGLKNIVSRVKKMGAQLEINSKITQGTEVSIKILNLDLRKQRPVQKNLRTTAIEA